MQSLLSEVQILRTSVQSRDEQLASAVSTKAEMELLLVRSKEEISVIIQREKEVRRATGESVKSALRERDKEQQKRSEFEVAVAKERQEVTAREASAACVLKESITQNAVQHSELQELRERMSKKSERVEGLEKQLEEERASRAAAKVELAEIEAKELSEMSVRLAAVQEEMVEMNVEKANTDASGGMLMQRANAAEEKVSTLKKKVLELEEVRETERKEAAERLAERLAASNETFAVERATLESQRTTLQQTVAAMEEEKKSYSSTASMAVDELEQRIVMLKSAHVVAVNEAEERVRELHETHEAASVLERKRQEDMVGEHAKLMASVELRLSEQTVLVAKVVAEKEEIQENLTTATMRLESSQNENAKAVADAADTSEQVRMH